MCSSGRFSKVHLSDSCRNVLILNINWKLSVVLYWYLLDLISDLNRSFFSFEFNLIRIATPPIQYDRICSVYVMGGITNQFFTINVIIMFWYGLVQGLILFRHVQKRTQDLLQWVDNADFKMVSFFNFLI